MSPATVLIMSARLSFLVALGAGGAFTLGADIPLQLHTSLGWLTAGIMLSIALLALWHRAMLTGALVLGAGLLVPLTGVMQLSGMFEVDMRLLQGLHIAETLLALGLCEMAAKRIKNGQPVQG